MNLFEKSFASLFYRHVCEIIRCRCHIFCFFILLLAGVSVPVSATDLNSNGSSSTSVENQLSAEEATETAVVKPSASIHISKDSVTVKKGKKYQIKYTYTNTSKKNIIWTSSNSKIVKVNSKGKITVKGGGKVIITARIKGTDIQDQIVVKAKNYYKMRFKTTGYCNGRYCCGKWAGHRTASGKYPKANHTIAVDKRVIKLGTKVKIGNTVYTAEDTGVRGRVIDVYYRSHKQASRHGVQWVTAKVYY